MRPNNALPWILAVVMTCAPLAPALIVDVEAGSSSCFSLELVKGSAFSGNYEAITDFDMNALDVKVTGPAPKNREYFASSREDGHALGEASFALGAVEDGDHTLCITNEHNEGQALTLGFAFRTGVYEDLESATEASITSMAEVASEMAQGLDLLADHQEFMRVREEGHRASVVATNAKVLWWSVAEAAVLAAMSLWQVVYLRAFFETKRSM